MDYDYVVIGAGSAGCVVAARLLARTDARVLVIEAGAGRADAPTITNPSRWVENLGSEYDWQYSYEPSPHVAGRRIPLARGKVVGGSGSINATAWVRGNRHDFDGWAAMGNEGWEYDSVLPLFKRSEDWEDGETDHHGAGGPIPVERVKDLHPAASALIDSGISLGLPYLDDYNVPEPFGVGPLSLNVRDGMRKSPWDGYLGPLQDNPRLTLRSGARARLLTFAGTRCTGVEYEWQGQIHTATASSEVILCAGAIDSPRLLLNSGIGPADELSALGIHVLADLPVGRNLQDHPLLGGFCFETEELPPVSGNLSGSSLFWRSRPEFVVPDIMLVSMQVPYLTAELAQEYPPPAHGIALLPGLMRPQSRGYVRLRAVDGPLEIQSNFLAAQADVEALLAAVELCTELAVEPAYRKLIRSWVAPARRMSRDEAVSFIRTACSSYFHPVGTCAMGTVVDSRLEVHGIDGLRVADASVMPTITSANTHAPTIMIAEAAADFLS
ncbi:GMC family oxidoreductase [Kutzneria chonburiensis]|uniref:GMC family oxidoreductase n=1 Tax=Kutzneria chonburiensis TaxID=1483604 RepID=A0ABV6N603_9PSEU|nr:GMC family oxidoreductase N-terminal domain-containing protein [Kutzneria chonburiensis]